MPPTLNVRPLDQRKCLNLLIPFGERHHRRAVAEFVAHYHRERNHQGLDNELIESEPAELPVGRVSRHQRLGGLLITTPAQRERRRVNRRGLRQDGLLRGD
jgi:hypothetical protein